MADPKVPEPQLTSQGQIYKRAFETDEKVPEIAPEYRGSGAVPQQEEDENKPWISEGHIDADVGELKRPEPDLYAQELYKRLGPVNTVTDKIEDAIETAIKKVSGTSKSASDIKNSAAGTFSQYTQAAWDKMNELKPTIGANHEPRNASSPAEGKESILNERMAEIPEKGHHYASSIAENVKNKTPGAPDVGRKLLAAGGDDVFKVVGDGASTEDPLKANMRATTEMLM